MNISELNIRRPVMTTLVMAGILLFGVVAYIRLPVSDLPNVDFPTIMVMANLPGASPETMASTVATPLEKQFSTIAGVDSMSSSSSQGQTQITLTFALSRNLDAAAQDVQAAIARAQAQLPPEMPTPPSYQKVNPADQPVLYVALTSSTLPVSTLDFYGQTMLAQRISTISGVAQVLVFGAQKYAVRVQVDPQALSSMGVGIDEVSDAIRKANVNLPTGALYGEHRSFTIQASGQVMRAKDYLPLIVSTRRGAPVRLRDVGTAFDSVENNKTAAWFVDKQGQHRAVVLAIQRQPGTNTVEVTNAVKAVLPTFQKELPASAAMNILYDRSDAIKESVSDVKFTLVLTLGLVILVIFLFLRNIRATVIPSLTLPLSVVGTFLVMYWLDYSLDNLSLMALTLATGFVIDDAIVMLENIYRHTEMGKNIFRAALDGSKEIVFTILSMTISLAAVFIPFMVMGGIVGRLFREFAVTIGAAILVSGFVSLTLIPMLSSRYLRPAHAMRHGRLYALSEVVFSGMLWAYRGSLAWALRHKLTMVVLSLGVLGGTVYLFGTISQSLFPSEDRNMIFGFTEAAQDISYVRMFQEQQKAADIIIRNPNVNQMMSMAGGRGGIGSLNTGVVFMTLKPRQERTQHVDQILQDLSKDLAKLPGIQVFLQNPAAINPSGKLSRSQYQYTLQSAETNLLYKYAHELETRVKEIPGFQDVATDVQLKNPQVWVDIDRDKASALGLTPAQVEDALYTAYGSRQISTIYAANEQYQVILEVLPDYQRNPAALSMLYVRSNRAQLPGSSLLPLVPLSTVVKFREQVGPLSVNHQGQLTAVTLSFNLKPGMSLGDAVSAVEKAAANRPATVSGGFQGLAQAFQESGSSLMILMILAVVVIYMVLGILYESFIHPITILTALPFAGFGALLTLKLFHQDLSIYAFVGMIMLVGLVKKNGIMMVDFAIARRNEGRSAHDAIFDACLVRFRPIMMTTFAALMAGLPIALGVGAGAESRRPLGLAVVGGLLFSQTLTLYVTPVFYVYFERLQDYLRGRKNNTNLEPAAVPQPPPLSNPK